MKQAPPQTESTLKVIRSDEQPEDPTLKKQVQPISYLKLFRFADKLDKILMVCGSIAAIAVGASMPAFSLLWGNMTDSFQTSSSDPDNMVKTSKKIMFNFLQIGVGVFVACWIMMACWMISGERQSIKCRKQYLNALLRQQIGWFDKIDQTQLSSKFSTQTYSFQGGIGEKPATFLKVISTLVFGFVIAYIKGWQMALVVTAGIPAIGFTGYIYVNILQTKDNKTSTCYNEAGGKAQEVIGAIKTVKSLNGEAFESSSFELKLAEALRKSFKYSILAGVGIGAVFFAMLACYALGFWYGSKLVHDKVNNLGEPYSAGDVLVVFFSILMGGFQLSNMTPCLKKFAEAQAAAAKIFAVIDRVPKIIRNPDGKKIDNLVGIIKFENVHFAYPKQPQRKILNGISFQIKPNQTTAFVGQSGCGKSTVMQLLMRFYDPLQGRITLDGIDIRQLDLQWLRQKVGYVGQQPVLFATTIKENLLFGNPKATDTQIIQALKKAQAYQFIMDLDKKLETYVGYGGGQLSGGQKQRIAIARAILKNPRILLLDQATSALDRKNQKLIQNTLNKISTGRTTISIAHRVKTIMTADNIIVVSKGLVKQSGPFSQLERFKDYRGQLENNNDNQNQNQNQIEEKKQDIKQQQASPVKLQHVVEEQNVQKQKKKKGKQCMTKEQLIEEEKKQEEKRLMKQYGSSIFKRMFGYTRPDFDLVIVGLIAAIGNGVIFPIFSIFLSKMIGILIQMQFQNGQQSIANKQALIFFGLALAGFAVNFVQNAAFGIVGDRLTRRVRVDVFNKMIRMPGSWFDLPKNNAGTLTSRLSTDCKNINGVTSTYLGVMIQNIACLLSGLIIAFIYEWRITLVTIGMIPFMIGAGVIQMQVFVGFSQQSGEAYKDSGNLIMEAMINIRTVTSFGVQNTFTAKYESLLVKPFKLAIRSGNLAGFLFGASQLVMFVIFALVFYIGTLFVRKYNLDFVDVFTAIYALIFAAMTAGNNTQMMPDLASCKTSATYLFSVLDGEDQDQIQIKEKSQMLTEGGTKGQFEIKNITFKYPTRKFNTFENFSLNIKSGNKVAFVGPSGCGKSTIIQMLLRFYSPDSGDIFLDGINIKNFDIHYLRSLYGLVSQEPVLFNTTFAANIKYDKADATIEDIRMAATKANAISFIETSDNSEGFNRGVGVKGSQISGGQKQRVAIARAMLRNPRILLLDEATSALDSANQKLVQDSLDNMMVGKTSISVAHRIQTIKNSDCIFVFSAGNIIESGTYSELVQKKGHFYDLEQGNSK